MNNLRSELDGARGGDPKGGKIQRPAAMPFNSISITFIISFIGFRVDGSWLFY